MGATSDLRQAARELAAALHDAGCTADGIAAHLGPAATAALYRGEPGVVLEACRNSGDSELSQLIRVFLVRVPTPRAELDALLTPELVQLCIDAGVFSSAEPTGSFAVALDIRPHVLAGAERFVISDLDASMTAYVPGPDHVLGVGAASLSLLQATPTTPVERVLDLGTGSGVQALAQATCAKQVVATDVHPRALTLADATFTANHVDNVELREGPWFTPVAGERFDRIVANPPFVVGPAEVGHIYRDSGLDLDGASELVAREAADHLAEGGTACILGAWAHVRGQSWRQRVASWLPAQGVSAWVLQRDEVDPGQYVSTWLRDESIDVRSPEGIARTQRWLEYFRAHEVESIGFGWIFLRVIGDRPSEITAEELAHRFEDPLGPEVEEYFLRAAWLRDADADAVLDATYMVRPSVALEEVSLADTETGMGFAAEVTRITRTEGPRFSHEIDTAVRSLLSGLHPHGLPLRDVVGLLAASQSIGDVGELEQSVVRIVVDLVRHGLVLPAELVAE